MEQLQIYGKGDIEGALKDRTGIPAENLTIYGKGVDCLFAALL